MSDNAPRSLGEIFYSGGVKESPQGPITGSPATSRSETPAGPPSLADILYSAPADPGIQQARNVIGSGKARETPRDELTMHGVRYNRDGAYVGAPPAGGRSLGQAFYPDSAQPASPAPDAAFDPSTFSAPEGFEVDKDALAEFAQVAKAQKLNLNHGAATELVALAHRAQTAAANRQIEAWTADSKSHFGDELPSVVREVRSQIDSLGEPGREFIRLMQISGLGSNRSVLSVLHALSQNGRRY